MLGDSPRPAADERSDTARQPDQVLAL